MPSMNFRALVAKAQRAGRARTEPPIPVRELAKRCRVSPTHFYRLLGGYSSTHGSYGAPPDHTIERLAEGLGVTAAAVSKALQESRREREAAGVE